MWTQLCPNQEWIINFVLIIMIIVLNKRKFECLKFDAIDSMLEAEGELRDSIVWTNELWFG